MLSRSERNPTTPLPHHQTQPREASDLDLLDKAGAEGWELIVITIAYLKRPASKPRLRQKR